MSQLETGSFSEKSSLFDHLKIIDRVYLLVAAIFLAIAFMDQIDSYLWLH